MSENALKSPMAMLHESKTIAVKPVVVEALRRKCASLKALREKRTGKKTRAGSSPPILPAAIILSGLMVYERKYSKKVIVIRDKQWMTAGLNKNDIERGEKLLIEFGFIEKKRGGFKGSKHYVVNHQAVVEQIPDLLGFVLDENDPESDACVGNRNPTHVSETERLSEVQNSDPESDASVGNRNPTYVSETDQVCISNETKNQTIDRRGRVRESNGNEVETEQGSIDGRSEEGKGQGKEKSNAQTLDDFEEQVRAITETDLTASENRFGEHWSPKFDALDIADLSRLAHVVGDADRGRLVIAAKTCAKKVASDDVDLPWRYLLRSANTLVEKRAKRNGTNSRRSAVVPSSNSKASTISKTKTNSGTPVRTELQEELVALSEKIGADQRLLEAEAVPSVDGEKLVVALNTRHAGQLQKRYGNDLDAAGWRIIVRGDESSGKADANGEEVA